MVDEEPFGGWLVAAGKVHVHDCAPSAAAWYLSTFYGTISSWL
jgi:hypothetical protein